MQGDWRPAWVLQVRRWGPWALKMMLDMVLLPCSSLLGYLSKLNVEDGKMWAGVEPSQIKDEDFEAPGSRVWDLETFGAPLGWLEAVSYK